MYVIKIEKRDKLIEYLKRNGISSGVHYPKPLHLQPAYKNIEHDVGDFPVAENYYDQCLSLPMYPTLGAENQDFVIQKTIEFCQ